jgi:hypothetical protein
MQFYEQVLCDARTVISNQIEPDAVIVNREIGADCWIDAKKRLGYGLSVTQEWLLDKFYEDRQKAAA